MSWLRSPETFHPKRQQSCMDLRNRVMPDCCLERELALPKTKPGRLKVNWEMYLQSTEWWCQNRKDLAEEQACPTRMRWNLDLNRKQSSRLWDLARAPACLLRQRLTQQAFPILPNLKCMDSKSYPMMP